MDIRSFLNRSNKKKRDLKSGSKENDAPKRQSEESPDVSCLDSPTSPGNVFAESLRSNECVEILMNCLKNLEKEVKELKDLASSNNANQIKGERQLLDLKDAVDFISNKLDHFESDRLEKKKIIEVSDLSEKVTYLRGKVDSITAETDRQEQYSRRNCLLIHGIPENKNENTDVLTMEVIDTMIDIKIVENNIDRTHRIGNQKKNGKPRPVIIKFVRYNDRKKVFSSKKLLKDSGVSITESLNGFRMKKLTNTRENFGFRNVWTVDVGMFYSENGSQHPKIYYNLLILTVVVLRKMEILCAILFALFSLSLFLGISESFFSHVCLHNSTLQCAITPLIICFDFKIKNYFNYSSFISLKYQGCFFKKCTETKIIILFLKFII